MHGGGSSKQCFKAMNWNQAMLVDRTNLKYVSYWNVRPIENMQCLWHQVQKDNNHLTKIKMLLLFLPLAMAEVRIH